MARGGGPTERRCLSSRALTVEKTGHVCEGLLDHTAGGAVEPVLGLFGWREHETEVALAELERLSTKDETAKLDFLEEKTGRGRSAIKNALVSSPMPKRFSRGSLMAACDNNAELFQRVLPFAGLSRTDTFGNPVVITAAAGHLTTRRRPPAPTSNTQP